MGKLKFSYCTLCLLLALLWGATACSDDEKAFPNIRSELGELYTDAQGKPSYLLLDNGKRTDVQLSLKGLRPDSLYRVQVTYAEHADQRFDLRQLLPIVAAPAFRLEKEPLRQDPVRLLSAWTTARYLNLRLALPRSFKHPHVVGFVEQRLEELPQQHKLHLALYHDAKADRTDYHEEVILSCPLFPYSSVFTTPRDSVVLHIATQRGMERIAFAR